MSKKKKVKSFKLSQEQFKFLTTIGDWNIVDIPKENWAQIPGIQRLKDTFAIMASGSFSDPRIMDTIQNLVAGIDVLTLEDKPKVGEPDGNAYHYVFQLTNDPIFPYTMYGPYLKDSIVAHRFGYADIDKYFR